MPYQIRRSSKPTLSNCSTINQNQPPMQIILLKGYHLTATERAAIREMLEKGYATASNSTKTKIYSITKGWIDDNFWHYCIEIKTRGTFTIGKGTETRAESYTIKTNKVAHQHITKAQPQIALF